MLPKEVLNRIEKNAVSKYGGMSKGYLPYIMGAKDEAERSQKLVAALEKVVACCNAGGNELVLNDINKFATVALNEYNKP